MGTAVARGSGMVGSWASGAILSGFGALHLVYTYAAYPWLVSRLPRRAPQLAAPWSPLVSVIIAARITSQSEIDLLVAKVQSLVETITLSCELIVALDGPSPAVAAALEEFGDARVRAVTAPKGSGKAVALNRGVEIARGDALIFTDLRQDVRPGSAEELILRLGSPDVGAVAGALELDASDRPEGLYERYWRFERGLRAREAEWDSAVGVSGALYALKRELWQPIPAGLILDDVWVPMNVVRAGKRVAFAAEAVAVDRGAGSDAGELARKVRTLTGNYQLLAWMPWLLNPIRNRIWWQFMSHKVMRLLTPLALACCAVGLAVLLPLPVTVALTLLLIVGAVLRARRSSRKGPGVGVGGGLRSAGVLVAALVVAALNAMRGRWEVWHVGESQ